jgi:tetratricopeptide (TPR) repeat protein
MALPRSCHQNASEQEVLMPTPFLSSEEYDERAHRLYDDGDYDGALEILREGLRLYPHSVELYVGLGYTRLAREEFAWAKQAFERSLVLDPEHEDGQVGMGESLLRFGQRGEALRLFRTARAMACGDLQLLLTIGRALYREQLYEEARDVLAEAVDGHPNSGEAAAALGYTLHRLGDEAGAGCRLVRALQLDGDYHEARVYLGHLLYDRGDRAGAVREFERVPPWEHWDPLALCRLIDLKRSMQKLEPGAPELDAWERRLAEVEAGVDPVDELLAEVEATAEEERTGAAGAGAGSDAHRVQLPDGRVAMGTWADIVEQLRRARAPAETVAQFMQRLAREAQAAVGVHVSAGDACELVRAGAQAGFWQIEY